MKEVIVVGELTATGRDIKGRYKYPYVEVNTPNGEEFLKTIDELCGDVILSFPIKYREATGYTDIPTFKVTLFDKDDQKIDEIEHSPWEDTYGMWDFIDRTFTHVINVSNVPIGENAQPLTYKCHMEVTLRRWTRPQKPGEKPEELTELKEEKTVIVHFKALSTCEICFEALWPNFGYGSYEWWKIPFAFTYNIRNLGNRTISSCKIGLVENEYLASAILSDENSSPIESKTEYYDFIKEISPGESSKLTLRPFKYEWEWFEYSNGSLEILYDDLEKKYHYYTNHIQVNFKSGTPNPLILGNPKTITNCVFRISVPESKKYKAQELRSRLRAIKDADGAGFLFNLLKYLPLPGSRGFTLLKTLYDLTSGSREEVVEKLKNYIDDPIEFDENYKLSFDYKTLIKEYNISKDLPEEFIQFHQSLTFILALDSSVNITFARFMSALLKEDKKSAKLQKRTIENLFSLMEEKTIFLYNNLTPVKLLMENLRDNQEIIEIINEILQIIKEEGIPKDFIEEKLKEGYTQEQINKIEELLRNSSYEDLILDQSPNIENLYYFALDAHVASLELLKKTQKIILLDENDILREFLKEGLIDDEEFHNKLDNANNEESYLIRELKFIDDSYKGNLNDVGVLNTQQLLDKCKNPYKREKFARIMGISRKVILEWANRADLMRITGVGEEYANMLEEIGVDTVIELSTRKAENLYKTISNYAEEARWSRKPPSKSQVVKWIKTAKKMDRKLEY